MHTRSWHSLAIIVTCVGIAACIDSQPLAPTSPNEAVITSAASAFDSAFFEAGRKEKPQKAPVDTIGSVTEVILDVATQDLTVGQTVQFVVTLKIAEGKTLTGRSITY